jgi:signal transduction histidine kinase
VDEGTGFGLGLSIARTVIEAHGGTLQLVNRAPSGLIAMVRLPCSHTKAAA